MKTSEPTPFYIRNAHSETFYVESLEEALEEFCGPEGYRLTLSSKDGEIVIRRGEWNDTAEEYGIAGIPGLRKFSLGQKAEATIVWRKMGGEDGNAET